MLEKTNKRLAVTLALLIIVIVAILFARSQREDDVVDANTYNAFDLKSVDQVVMSTSEWKTELKFDRYRWRVNDKFDADRNLVDVLFATVKQARPRQPVASSAQDSVTSILKQKGVQVSLYSQGEKQITFYAGGDDDKKTSWFLKENGDEPHVMVIPGYRVYVSGIFEVPPTSWRDKLVFNLNWQNFSGLEAIYKNPAGNFNVFMEKSQVFIPGIEADTAKLNTYLDQVSLLTVDEFIPGNSITDSIGNTQPQVRLVIRDIASREYILEIFAADDRFYGRLNNEMWAIIDRNRVLPILRPKEYFVRR